MADLTVVPARVATNNKEGLWEMVTGPADEVVLPGQVVRYNVTTGHLTKANGSTAAEARAFGVAIKEAKQAGDTITAIRKGYVDLGDALDALDYDAVVFLSNTDGTLADTAGTVSTAIGRVVPVYQGTVADKILRVDL